jgi:hypothetical protein
MRLNKSASVEKFNAHDTSELILRGKSHNRKFEIHMDN